MTAPQFPPDLVERCRLAFGKTWLDERNSDEFAPSAVVLAVLAEAFTWQPMESAPKDGTPVLLRVPDAPQFNGVVIGWRPRKWRAWTDSTTAKHWIADVYGKPTGWMHLPPTKDAP